MNLDSKPNLLNKVSMSNDKILQLKKRMEVVGLMQRALRISEQRVQTLEKNTRQMENSALKRQKDSQLVEIFKQMIDNIRIRDTE